MPRNQSELVPQLVAKKAVTPLRWDRPAKVRFWRLVDGTYDVTVDGRESDPTFVGHKLVATIELAQRIYDAYFEGFRYGDIPGPGWINTNDGPQ